MSPTARKSRSVQPTPDARRKKKVSRPADGKVRKSQASLAEYHRKRDFQQTAEPAGKLSAATGRSRYCVQKHDASHLHYDFRLELDGVLKSWAVPKGPSLDPSERRLAIHVEDHPLDYGGFEGTIPQGQYGGGTVMLWDRGRWTPQAEPRAAYRAGRLKFTLQGEKLQGGWMLVRRGGHDAPADEKTWFLIKERDEFARPHDEFSVTEAENKSVKTGRDLDQIAAGKKAKAKSTKKPAGKKPASGKSAPRAKRTKRGKKQSSAARGGDEPAGSRSALPKFVEPQLATLVKQAPEGDDWLHEIKFDGYRMQVRIANGHAQFTSRNQLDWTTRFGPLAAAVVKLPLGQALLDGEVVVLEPDGTTSFQALQNVLNDGQSGELVYFAFDLLHLDGQDLSGLPLEDRKAKLADLIEETKRGPIRYVEHIAGHGPEFFQQACTLGLEGIISKRRGNPYRGGRSDDWLKVKCQQRDEFVIVGYTDPEGARTGFGALLLGYHERNRLVYAGRVGTGFSDKTLASLTARLKRLSQSKPPLDEAPPGSARHAHWVRPELVAQIEFAQWTRDGILRHPSFQGLREDKPAADVVRDKPKSREEIMPKASAKMSVKATAKSAPKNSAQARAPKNSSSGSKAGAKTDEPIDVGGVRITHPDRVLYPDVGLTKAEVAAYYAAVADWMLPHAAGRPLSLVRCPVGLAAECFYQKHVEHGMPAAVKHLKIREKNGSGTHGVIDSAAGLISLVQFGVLEIHIWGSRADDVERPDRLVFDLDPDPSVEWKSVISAARLLRERLAELGLQSFVKTTGGKGLHVVLPIRRRDEWPAMKLFCHRFVDHVVVDYPEAFTANMSKAARHGKIYLDYLRNERGATWVAPYSTRARAGATVSVPLEWDELSGRIRADHFTVENLPARLKKLKRDPWEEIDEVQQSITAKIKKAVGMT